MNLPNANDLVNSQIPKINIIDDYFAEGEILMMFAPSGVGKTFNALNMAISISHGGRVYGDAVIDSRRCLYVDGEMGARALGNRLREMLKARHIANCSDLVTIPCDIFQDGVLNLSLEQNQNYVTEQIKLHGIKVLFLDNYNTLCPDDGNMFLTWDKVSKWLRQLKALGVATVLVHHTNKQNEQFAGSAKMHQMMDVVINFTNSPLARAGEKLIEMNFDKVREGQVKEKKLLQLLVDEEAKTKKLVSLDYQSMLKERLVEDYDNWGFQYVNNKYSIPQWRIREICNIKPKDTPKGESDGFTKFNTNLMKNLGSFL